MSESNLSATRSRREDGFALVMVLIALLIGTLLAIAALAAATGDFPSARDSQDRKAAYAAAESGLQYFNFRLSRDNDYWKTCGDGGAGRIDRTVPGTNEKFTIEFLPANGRSACSTVQPEATMINSTTGRFRIRATGHVGKVYRSVVASYRRKSFLDFVYFTSREVTDPALTSNPTANAVYCAPTRSLRTSCPNQYEIQWADFDRVNGPLHTDDESLLTCAGSTGPVFGTDGNDAIEVTGPSMYVRACGGAPKFKGTQEPNSGTMGMPDSNSWDKLAQVADPAWTFTGKVKIQLNSNGTISVWKLDTNGNTISPALKSSAAAPSFIYVKGGSCTNNKLPTDTDYKEDAGCGNAYVSGTYSTNLSIAAPDGDIVITSNIGRPTGSDALLGLMASRYVRVWHPCSGALSTLAITAAILATDHSFMVDNYTCGPQLGNLTVTGGIAQKFRGPVGTSGGTGYKKDYWYDDKLRYRNPPYFLDPQTAAWNIVRSNEQVPATRPTGL